MAKQKTIPELETEKAENERKITQLQHKKRNRQSRQRLDRHGTIVVGSCETFHHYNVQGVK